MNVPVTDKRVSALVLSENFRHGLDCHCVSEFAGRGLTRCQGKAEVEQLLERPRNNRVQDRYG